MSERYELKQCIENAKESCHYCHNTTLQQVGNEKCALTVEHGSTVRRI